MALRAALFDMDRTLLAADTAWLFTRHRFRRREIGMVDVGRVAYWTLQYRLGVIDAPRVAARVLADYAGHDERELTEHVETWFRADALHYLRARARETVERHRAEGDILAIATSATPYGTRPLARELGIDHIVASELEVDPSGRLTGRVVEPLCYGTGKLARVRCLAEKLGFRLEDSVFYSDSINDLPLLERVGTPVVVTPDRKLRRIAERRGWRVERW